MVPVFDRRKLRPLILALAIALCAFQLTTCTGMWLLDPLIVRATHVGLVLSMLFLWRSSNRALRKNPRPEPAWSFLFDILMIAMSAGAAAYIITNFSYIQDRMPHIDELTAWDLFWGAGLIIAILEATRRVAGLALVIVSGIALLYAFFGHLLPGNMGHLYLAPNQIIESLYLLNDGIWGSSIGASATIIYVFILFGALLEKTKWACPPCPLTSSSPPSARPRWCRPGSRCSPPICSSCTSPSRPASPRPYASWLTPGPPLPTRRP